MNHLSTVRTALAAAVLACTAAAASAADYSFNGNIAFADASELVGQSFAGSFSVDLPAADFTGNLPLSAFSFSFGGQTYTLDTAISAPSAYIDAGQLSLFQYGSSLNGTSLDIAAGFPDVMQGTMSLTDSQGRFSTGSFQISAVPEPDAYAMLLGGLGLVGWLARRRQVA